MTEVATRAGGVPALAPQEPRLSAALRAEVERMLDPHDPSQGRYVTEADRREARLQAAAYDTMLVPVSAQHLLEWLISINRAARNPQDRDAFRQRAQAFEIDLGHLPAGCFTGDTRRDLLRDSDGFFPSVGQALNLLEPLQRGWERRQAALKKVAATPIAANASRPSAPDDAERARVAERVAELKRHVATEDARRAPPRLTANAKPLAPQHLIAAYEVVAANPNPLVAAPAIARLEVLRRQVGA